jgi:hypothetical protein
MKMTYSRVTDVNANMRNDDEVKTCRCQGHCGLKLIKQPSYINETTDLTGTIKAFRVTVAGKATKDKKWFCSRCLEYGTTVDNRNSVASLNTKRNGIYNYAVIKFGTKSSKQPDDIKAWLISGSYTLLENTWRTMTVQSPIFSGCSSISKKLKNASEKFNLYITDFVIYDKDLGTHYNITMKNGDNKAYTEAIRLFNENKIEKLEAWLEEHN